MRRKIHMPRERSRLDDSGVMASFTQTLFDPETGYRPHRPLVGWASAIVAGTALGFFFGGGWLWLVAATLGLALAWRRTGRYPALFLLLACLSLVAWRAARVHDWNAAVRGQLTAFQEREETFPLKVTVSNDRQVIWRKRGGPYCRFLADEAWLPDGTKVHGVNLLVHWYDRSGTFPEPGQTWQVQAKLHRRAWYSRANLSVRGETARLLAEADREWNLRYGLSRLRDRLAEHLAFGVSPSEAALTQTMVLGMRNRLPYEARQRYADAGIIHIFAISGLHVGIVAGFLIWFLAWVGVRLRLRWLLLFPVLVGYLLLTGIPPSAARACVMALIFCFAPCMLRRSDAPSALFVTAAGVLVVEPGWIANVGALLSFGVMGGILLWMRPLAYFANRLMRSVPRRNVLGELPEIPPWHLRLRQNFAAVLGLAISAWLAALPLCLFFFGRVSFVGLLLNLAVPTITLLIVWSACASALVGFVLPAISVVLNRVNAFLLNVINDVSSFFVPLPWAVFETEVRPGIVFTLSMEFLFVIGGLWLRTIEARQRRADPLDPENHCFLPEPSRVGQGR